MFKRPRGTADILPEEQPYRRTVRDVIEAVCAAYGYDFIDTPVFEDAALFVRSVGEGTDIVEKEMYIFEDRGGDRFALRPELTAPACRAYLEHGLFNLPQPVRLAYLGPGFRYERPQAGRYRAFTQFGIEAIGDPDPSLDAEVIDLGWRVLERLGLRGLTILLNSIGDPACRPGYLEILRSYYRDRLAEVCADDRVRFEKNPLRLLDCKTPSCQHVISAAPALLDNLCEPCAAHFARLRQYLEALGLSYTIQPRLVRGLDYYRRTVFEIVPETATGQQGTLFAGGRYDGLIEMLGGRPTPGLGFAMGIERVILNLRQQQIEPGPIARPWVFVAHIGEAAQLAAIALAGTLRAGAIGAVAAPGGRSLKAQLRAADSTGARFAVIIGDEELANCTVQLRDLRAATQDVVPSDSLLDTVRRRTAAT